VVLKPETVTVFRFEFRTEVPVLTTEPGLVSVTINCGATGSKAEVSDKVTVQNVSAPVVVQDKFVSVTGSVLKVLTCCDMG